MRPIHIVRVDKPRPAVILTREAVRSVRSLVTVAPITSSVRGLAVEVPIGVVNGVDDRSVVNCDVVQTVRADKVGRLIGQLYEEQELALTEAVLAAFDLRTA